MLALAKCLDRVNPLEIHRASLSEGSKYWSKIRSNTTCLFCLVRRPPEHVLPCGHSMCDQCVQLWGRGQPGPKREYRLDSCLLCQTACTKFVRLNPPTAGIRILSIDGGGIRGIVPLETLEILQIALGPELRIQDFFDLSFGTSVGEYTSPSTICQLY
jgi:hypothetical protein